MTKPARIQLLYGLHIGLFCLYAYLLILHNFVLIPDWHDVLNTAVIGFPMFLSMAFVGWLISRADDRPEIFTERLISSTKIWTLMVGGYACVMALIGLFEPENWSYFWPMVVRFALLMLPMVMLPQHPRKNKEGPRDRT